MALPTAHPVDGADGAEEKAPVLEAFLRNRAVDGLVDPAEEAEGEKEYEVTGKCHRWIPFVGYVYVAVT